MALSLISTPYVYEPIYTLNMATEISSTFKTEENFKYLFNLYVGNPGSYSLVNVISTYPRPTGTGVYSPHTILQSYCETSLNPFTSSIFSNENSKIYYYFQLGETYNPNLTFNETYLASSYVGNKLGFEFLTNITTELFIGDLITVDKDNISINSWINGTASIIGITNSTLTGYSKTVLTDRDLQTSVYSTGESGKIINLTRYGLTSSEYVGWNAARQYENKSDFFNEYILRQGSTQSKFLSVYETAYSSNLLDKKCIYTNEWETLDIITATFGLATFSTIYTEYTYFDSNGTVLGTDSISSTQTTTEQKMQLRFTVPTGTNNINLIGGSGSSFLNSGLLSSYNIRIGIGTQSGGIQHYITDLFNYKICQDCRPYDVIRLAFLNKLGGFDYWSFNLVSKYTSSINRNQINRALPYDYQIGDRGRDVIYSEAVENWTINTDFLTDDNALFIRELVESSNVYVIEDNEYIPVVITSNNWQFKSGLLDGYVQYTIEYQKSYDMIINR